METTMEPFRLSGLCQSACVIKGGTLTKLMLSFDEWPARDRAMWDRLVQDGGPLDECGALSHLREISLKSLKINYGRWLAWVAKCDLDALSEDPPAGPPPNVCISG